MREMAIRFVMKFLKKEEEQLRSNRIEIIEAEKQLAHTIHINGYEVYLRGYADRIDRFNGKTRIMDYKTGNVEVSALSQTESVETMDNLKTGEIIQVLFYDWVYSEMTGDKDEKEGGIFLLTKPVKHSIFLKYNKKAGIDKYLREKFGEILHDKLDELLNPDIPFRQTEDKEKCEYCDFRHICNR
jgi:CRISPR/Cas system-associated exonuclease Cas4 (RecB family)